MAKLLPVNGGEQSCRGSDSNVELDDMRSNQTSSPMAVFGWLMLVLLLVVVFNTSKLTHVFGSKVLVLVLDCYKLTLTPPSKHPM
jgi:hypothetical protein